MYSRVSKSNSLVGVPGSHYMWRFRTRFVNGPPNNFELSLSLLIPGVDSILLLGKLDQKSLHFPGQNKATAEWGVASKLSGQCESQSNARGIPIGCELSTLGKTTEGTKKYSRHLKIRTFSEYFWSMTCWICTCRSHRYRGPNNHLCQSSLHGTIRQHLPYL